MKDLRGCMSHLNHLNVGMEARNKCMEHEAYGEKYCFWLHWHKHSFAKRLKTLWSGSRRGF